MAETATRSRVPRIVTAVLGVVALVLVAVIAVLVVQRTRHERGLSLTSVENRVLDAAKQDFITLQTYRQTTFDQDFANAESVVTGSAKTNLAGSKASLQKTLSTNKTNSTASIVSASIVSSTGGKYQVLILASLETRDATGKLVQARPSPATLTMVKVKDTWLIADIQLVAAS
ncbi:MAG: hypothetical protein ACR2KJ_17305 [Jatrophihabitans sp.]